VRVTNGGHDPQARHEALRPFIRREHMPGTDVRSEEDIRRYIRRWSKTDYHPVGSCKMGHDEMAVVDPRLRVHGIDGLRVIDASIMPKLISGNTQAPSIMIGEKGAALVLESDDASSARARPTNGQMAGLRSGQ
jgi:choline dehydrogenase-like flavoprotein